MIDARELNNMRRTIARLEAQAAQQIPKYNASATAAPTTGDNLATGYRAGALWFDNTAGDLYVCTASTAVTATWEKLTA